MPERLDIDSAPNGFIIAPKVYSELVITTLKERSSELTAAQYAVDGVILLAVVPWPSTAKKPADGADTRWIRETFLRANEDAFKRR